jgi:adenylate kinase family enzyme
MQGGILVAQNANQSVIPDVASERLQRIVIVGASGSGKTTLARQLAQHLALPHVEMDALYWDTGWTVAPLHIFRERVTQALSVDGWVADGNYSSVRDLTWTRADTVVWLDYPLWFVLLRLLRRGIVRSLSREELWNGNREGIYRSLLARDSLVAFTLTTFLKKRRRYLSAQHDPAYAHLEIIRLRSLRAVRSWLDGLLTSK